jgi:hypothetical protein
MKTTNVHPLLGAALAVLAASALGTHALACPAPEEIGAAEGSAFTEADADGDGALTEDEFTVFGELMRAKLHDLRFATLDTDDSGTITEEELEAGHPRGRPRGRGPRF